MPQLDVSTFASQLFWLAICFVLLYVILSSVVMPRVGAVLDERERKINDNLDRAAALKNEAEAAIQGYEKALADARAKAHEHLRQAGAKIQAEQDAKLHALGDKLASEIKAGEARIHAAKDAAIQGVRAIAIEAAAGAAQKLIGSAIDSAKVGGAVDAVLGARK
jgi:F-type H+-transporting ATPase subunit b